MFGSADTHETDWLTALQRNLTLPMERNILRNRCGDIHCGEGDFRLYDEIVFDLFVLAIDIESIELDEPPWNTRKGFPVASTTLLLPNHALNSGVSVLV